MISHPLTIWPLREEPALKSAALFCAVIALAALSAMAGEAVWWTVFTCAVLGWAAAPYMIPTTYQVRNRTLDIIRPWGRQELALDAFATLHSTPRGLWLTAKARNSRWIKPRRLFIPVRQRPERTAFVAALLDALNPPANENKDVDTA